MEILDNQFYFGTLYDRDRTDLIIIHHSDGGKDIDFSAAQIHDMHLDNGYVGIGYHFVIRKDGTIERGRPIWAEGAHTYRQNHNSIGICLSGDFSIAKPTEAQLDSCRNLIAYLCETYKIPRDRKHICGHRQFNETDCPGDFLYNVLDSLLVARRIDNIFDLARLHSNVTDINPYGWYHFQAETLAHFLEWLSKYPDKPLAHYATFLLDAKDFDAAWLHLATVDPGHFSQLQTEFALQEFYLPTVNLLNLRGFALEQHSTNLQAVVFAYAIRFSPTFVADNLNIALQSDNAIITDFLKRVSHLCLFADDDLRRAVV